MRNLSRLLPALGGTLLLLAACGVPPQPDETAAPAPSSSLAAPAASSAPASAASPQAVARPSGADHPAPSALKASAAAGATLPSLPRELIIPAIKVDAPVEQLGTTSDGAMDAPHEWNDVGWFDLGYRPGERGNAVIAGHLDSTTDKAVFWDLRLLKPGDKVLVKDESGAQLTFQVVSSETYPYNDAPLQKIFGPAGGPMLNLVTCNGVFDRGSKNYDRRLVVYTREVAA